jgi:hypothetical protein
MAKQVDELAWAGNAYAVMTILAYGTLLDEDKRERLVKFLDAAPQTIAVLGSVRTLQALVVAGK